MAQLIVPGNAEPLGGAGNGNSSMAREDMIIDKTKDMAFPMGPVLSLENFEHYGTMPAGHQQSLGDMTTLCGKDLQESYRAGHMMSEKYHDKVSDR